MYYVVIIQNNSSQAVFPYNSYDDALAMFHTELAYRAETRTSTCCVILDYQGNMHKTEYWQKSNGEEPSGE